MKVLTKNSNGIGNTYAETKPFINEFFTWFQTAWAWSDSSITESEGVLTGKFYFKENVYAQFVFAVGSDGAAPGLKISFHSPNSAIESGTSFSQGGTGSRWWQISMAKSVSGFALAITINSTAPTTAKATNFTEFFGKCMSANNEEKYGAVFWGTAQALRIADEDEAMADNVYKIACNNSAGYQAVLFPICNPATGSVFKNIYEPKFCPFLYSQFMLGDHVFQAGANVNLPCLSDE